MTPRDFDALLTNLVTDEIQILASKGEDYTDNGEGKADEDRLFNFKEVGKRFGVSPLLVWGIYWTKHNNAIEKFVRTGAVASEPIEERIKDARNYLALGMALIEDLQNEYAQNEPVVHVGRTDDPEFREQNIQDAQNNQPKTAQENSGEETFRQKLFGKLSASS